MRVRRVERVEPYTCGDAPAGSVRRTRIDLPPLPDLPPAHRPNPFLFGKLASGYPQHASSLHWRSGLPLPAGRSESTANRRK